MNKKITNNPCKDFNNKEKNYFCNMDNSNRKRRENKYLKNISKCQVGRYCVDMTMPSSSYFPNMEDYMKELELERQARERQEAWDKINGIDRNKLKQVTERNALNAGSISQARSEEVVAAPMSAYEYGKAVDAAIDEKRKYESKYNRGYMFDHIIRSTNLGAGMNNVINGENISDKLLGAMHAILGTATLAGGANLISPRNYGISVVNNVTKPSYKLLNTPKAITPQIAKELAIGTASGEAVSQGHRLLDRIVNKQDRTWEEAFNDNVFTNEQIEKHPFLTDFLASMSNPGYYISLGTKGLEYTGALGKQLTNGISNGVNIAKNLFTKYTSRINPVTGKFEIVPEKNVGKDVAVRPVDFKSELDWNPENWFSKRIGEYGLPFDAHHNPKGYTENDIKSLQSHIPEYIENERKTKADDTWLKMPDGATWSGDPRSWVQLMSSDGQKLELQRLLTGVQRNEQYSFPTYTGNIWASDSKQFADYWAPDGKSFEISYPKTSKTVTYDAKDDFWTEMDIDGIPKDDFHNKVSNGVVKYGISQGNDIVKIKNIVESKRIPSLTDIYIRDGVPSKIIEGNNGNFDLSVLNKYRILIPFILPLINKNNEKNNNQN